jgi:hypothetical protein
MYNNIQPILKKYPFKEREGLETDKEFYLSVQSPRWKDDTNEYIVSIDDNFLNFEFKFAESDFSERLLLMKIELEIIIRNPEEVFIIFNRILSTKELV